METDEKLNFIINPNAGNGKTIKAINLISDILDKKKIAYHLDYAATPELARQFAAGLEAAGAKNIIIVGGDGTLSEVLNGLKNPAGLKLGLIPSGTGNDFAKTLGISKKVTEALEHILCGKTVQFDYLQGKSRRAVNTVSTGIDIAIIQKYNSYKKRNKYNYYKALFSTAFSFEYPHYKLNIDGKEHPSRDYFVVTACNGQYFGGGMKISPNSKTDDGKITLVRIHGMKKSKVLLRMLGFLKGGHIGKPYCEESECTHILLNDGEPMTVNFDGELMSDEPFDIKIIKNGMNIFFKKKG